jgi:hypothetical protein
MATDKTVNEESSAFLTVSFYDKDDVLTTPSSVQYHLHCLTNNVEVRTWTALSPASEIEIGLDANDNAIIDQWNHTNT